MALATSGTLLSPNGVFIDFGYMETVSGTKVSTMTTGILEASSDVSLLVPTVPYTNSLNQTGWTGANEIITVTSILALPQTIPQVSLGTQSVAVTTGNEPYYTLTIVTIGEAFVLPGTTAKYTFNNAITYSQLSASAIVTKSYIAPGTVYASGIQIRWTGPYPLIQHQGLASGAKTGIGLIVIVVSFIAVLVASLLSHRYKGRLMYASQYPEIGKEELPGQTFRDQLTSQSSPARVSTENRAVTGQHVDLTSDPNSSLAELGCMTSVRSDSALQREPAFGMVEIDSTPTQTMPRDITIPPPASPNKSLPTPVEEIELHSEQEQLEQQSFVATSTAKDSDSSQRETMSEIGEDQRLRAELGRIMERKERVRELARLKEEEDRLANIEEELR